MTPEAEYEARQISEATARAKLSIREPDRGEPIFRQEYPTADELVDHPRGGG
jgi:hypothetical protein